MPSPTGGDDGDDAELSGDSGDEKHGIGVAKGVRKKRHKAQASRSDWLNSDVAREASVVTDEDLDHQAEEGAVKPCPESLFDSAAQERSSGLSSVSVSIQRFYLTCFPLQRKMGRVGLLLQRGIRKRAPRVRVFVAEFVIVI